MLTHYTKIIRSKNQKFIKEILKDKTNYEIQDQREKEREDKFYDVLINDIDTKKVNVA